MVFFDLLVTSLHLQEKWRSRRVWGPLSPTCRTKVASCLSSESLCARRLSAGRWANDQPRGRAIYASHGTVDLLLALVSGVTAMAPVASADSHRDDRDSVEATSFNALGGAETPDEGVQALAFLPEGVTVHVGDSITWNFATHEPHPLSFLQPGQTRPPAATAPVTPNGSTFDGNEFVNSGILLNGATYSVTTFGASGDFSFVCLIHSKMSGTIHVQPGGFAAGCLWRPLCRPAGPDRGTHRIQHDPIASGNFVVYGVLAFIALLLYCRCRRLSRRSASSDHR